jgi:hypothetical protein
MKRHGGLANLSITKQNKGACHIVALPFYIKKNILRQKKKNDANSNIFHHTKI